MDTKSAGLACCLLALTFAVGQTENRSLTISPPSATSELNLTLPTTMSTSSNSTVTVIANITEDTTPYTSTRTDDGILSNTTAVPTERTSHPETSLSTINSTTYTNSTSLTTLTTPSTQTPTLTSRTMQTVNSTTGNISTTDSPATSTDSPATSTDSPATSTDSPATTTNSPATTTENSSHPVNTTLDAVNTTTPGLGLNISERNMTIVFSAMLGLFAVAMVMFMYHKCKLKRQFLHLPLNNTDDTGNASVADDDILVISGGLYDGHPIYDHVPTASEDQSQFRLEFLH